MKLPIPRQAIERTDLPGASSRTRPCAKISLVGLAACLLSILLTTPSFAACKCKSALVRTGDEVNKIVIKDPKFNADSGVYCVMQGLTFKDCRPVDGVCPTGSQGWICALGPSYGRAKDDEGSGKVENWIGYGMEARFTFESEEDFRDCTFGQGLQRTIKDAKNPGGTGSPNSCTAPAGKVKFGPHTFDIRAQSTFPLFGTKEGGSFVMGSDNYTAVGTPSTRLTTITTETKRDAFILRWADLPSIFLDEEDKKSGATIKDKVIVFVKPNGEERASCACTFDVTVKSGPGNFKITNADFSPNSSLWNCDFKID